MDSSKKVLNIVAVICSIVLGAIVFIGSMVILSALDEVEYYYGVEAAELLTIVYVLVLLISVALIVLASISIATRNGRKLGVRIALLVMLGLVALLEFLGDGIVYGFLFLIPFVLEILSLCLPSGTSSHSYYPQQEQASQPKQEQPQTATIDSKIKELQHLKELGVITDEQYDAAVQKIITDIK